MKVISLNMQKITPTLLVHEPYKEAVGDVAAKDNGQENPKQMHTASYAVLPQRGVNSAIGARKYYELLEPCRHISKDLVHLQPTFSPWLRAQYTA